MATIKEDYVSFEIAKLLKEKGFNERLLTFYITDEAKKEGCFQLMAFTDDKIDNNHSDFCYLAPTQQMAMKWLREMHYLYIQVMLDSWACGGHMGYYVVIQNTTSDFEMMLQDALDDVFYDTYEEACEAAIKYCIENFEGQICA